MLLDKACRIQESSHHHRFEHSFPAPQCLNESLQVIADRVRSGGVPVLPLLQAQGQLPPPDRRSRPRVRHGKLALRMFQTMIIRFDQFVIGSIRMWRLCALQPGGWEHSPADSRVQHGHSAHRNRNRYPSQGLQRLSCFYLVLLIV